MKRMLGPGERLEGVAIALRAIELADCTPRYVAWLRDPEVNRYLETRFTEQTLETVRSFVEGMVRSPHSQLFAIIERASGMHVGNIKLGPVNEEHLYADVSYFIGERAAWGRGYGTDAVILATRFGFERLGLHRVQAGFYETNVASQSVLKKAGFAYEGRLLKKLRQSPASPWEDHVWFGALRDTWPVSTITAR